MKHSTANDGFSRQYHIHSGLLFQGPITVIHDSCLLIPAAPRPPAPTRSCLGSRYGSAKQKEASPFVGGGRGVLRRGEEQAAMTHTEKQMRGNEFDCLRGGRQSNIGKVCFPSTFCSIKCCQASAGCRFHVMTAWLVTATDLAFCWMLYPQTPGGSKNKNSSILRKICVLNVWA